jgi:flagellar biosynthetic protein FliQ
MNEDFVLGVGQEALKVAFLVASPILLIAMAVGILVSLVQAVTQINEATLTFIPKVIAISLVLIVGGPWMLSTLTSYTADILQRLPEFVQ